MKIKRLWLWVVPLGLLLSAFMSSAPDASAVVVRLPNGHSLGITPRSGISPAAVRGSIAARRSATPLAANGDLDYNGGPVVHSSAPYLIFWAPGGESVNIPSSWRSLMERYFGDVAADSGKADDVYGVSRQYTDGTGFADYKQTFNPAAQALLDTDPYPPQDLVNCPDTDTSSSFPTCITDSQLQSEIKGFIAAHGLSTDGAISASELVQNAPIYFVVLPTDVNVCTDAADCASNVFCAYHGPTTSQDGSQNVLYAAIPTLPVGPSQNPKDCQNDGNSVAQEPNRSPADVVLTYMSHEDNESITDPLITAWYDDISGNEEADNCEFEGADIPQEGSNPDAFLPTLGGSESSGTLFDQLIDGGEYYLQSEWSNGDVNCKMRPTAGTLAPSFTVPQPGSTALAQAGTFTPSANDSSYPISSATWSFGDGSAQAFNSGGSALASVSHSYGALGRYTVTLTLVDDRGNLQSISEPVIVGAAPHGKFKFSPRKPAAGTRVSFNGRGSSDPDPGVTLTSYAWSFGDGKTGSGPKPTHTYKRAGKYTATLTVTNSIGARTIVSHSIVVVRDRITKVSVRSNANGTFLLVSVSGKGALTVGSRRFRVKRAKTVKLKISSASLRFVGNGSPPSVTIRVKFKPVIGRRSSRTVKLAPQ